jgi:predicted nucleic acid-binding protein
MEECASALSKRCRRADLTKADARVAFRLLELRQPLLVDERRQLRAAFELSILHHLSFWDSVYLALAIDKRCDIVTADRRFRTGAGKYYPFVTLLGEEPARRQ